MHKNKKDSEMLGASLKTGDALLDAVKSTAEEMLKNGLTEKSFVIPTTSMKFILVKKGTLSEESRVVDPASIMGGEYQFRDSVFFIARR